MAAFTTGGQTNNYSYDPEGLRTKKVTPSGTTRYHYDNTGRVITESNAGGFVTAQTIWGNQALARKVGGSYYYYLYNGHGDVTKVIDQNGNIVNSYTYDEWGNILSQQEQLPQPLKYAGEYYDNESGLYYLRARYYDPTVGRFISKDSDEGNVTNPLSLNLYTYCENDPVNNVDPSGHNPVILGLYAYASKVLTSPDTQNDLRLISIDIQKKDYLAAGLDTIGLLVPAGTGFGELSKPVQEGVVWLSKKLGKSVDEVLKMAGKGAGDTSKYVNIASKGKTKHILFGDATGGGHIWPGSPNKTPFPKGWSGDKIMHEVSDIATDPSLKWIENRVVKGVQRYEVVGVRGGVKIKVITDGKNIITAFPVK